uniref:Uncharacterized protein n=1 Tax=Tetranychus urticae TaxID=32264 RepID=T1KQD4_TETUR
MFKLSTLQVIVIIQLDIVQKIVAYSATVTDEHFVQYIESTQMAHDDDQMT